jgi:methylglutaconyl-CoA hydratase
LTLETISCDLSARGVATIVLNRPDRSNAFNQAMLNELGGQLSELAYNTNARVIVLRGSGKHFCAGADVSGRGDGGQLAEQRYSLHDVLAALDAQPQPTVAVVHGAAVGGGAGFVSCCDVVLASEAAFFSIPEVRIGMPPVRLARYLIRAMGYRSFRRYGLSGERMSPDEALRTGLAHEVCPAVDLDARAAAVVDALLHGAPGAMRELKQAMAGMAMPPIPGPDTDTAPAPEPTKSPEAMEGIASLREKRKPKWYPARE